MSSMFLHASFLRGALWHALQASEAVLNKAVSGQQHSKQASMFDSKQQVQVHSRRVQNLALKQAWGWQNARA